MADSFDFGDDEPKLNKREKIDDRFDVADDGAVSDNGVSTNVDGSLLAIDDEALSMR